MPESHDLQEISSFILIANNIHYRFDFILTKILASADMNEAMSTMQQFYN